MFPHTAGSLLHDKSLCCSSGFLILVRTTGATRWSWEGTCRRNSQIRSSWIRPTAGKFAALRQQKITFQGKGHAKARAPKERVFRCVHRWCPSVVQTPENQYQEQPWVRGLAEWHFDPITGPVATLKHFFLSFQSCKGSTTNSI